jgi:peptidyl-prolyl cis-trans isomerase SurA
MIKNIYIVTVLSLTLLSCDLIKKTTSLKTKKEPVAVAQETIKAPEPVIQIGDLTLFTEDLESELKRSPNLDSAESHEIIDAYVQRKLLVKEAESLGYLADPEFEEEINTYKKIILSESLINEDLLTKLQNESFENYKYEINASHIFVPLSEFASAADTLVLYNELLNLKKYAKEKGNFEVLAQEWSKDLKTSSKGGNLGWFTSMRLIYPIEKAAFSTAVDSISNPVRSELGYHLIKVNARRPNSGFVKVQQILKFLPTSNEKSTYDSLYHFMDSLKVEIEKGSNFNEMCLRYSDDLNSKETFGELPVFGIGTRNESNFEEASFDLKPGQVSPVVRSVSALHLIKLIQKYPALSKDEFLKSFEEKFTTDSRGEFLKNKSLEKIANDLKLYVNKEIFEQCLTYADNKILTRNWVYNGSELDKFVILKIGNKNYFVKDFFDYVMDKQGFERYTPTQTASQVFRMFFDQFKKKNLIEQNGKSITQNNSEINTLFNLQKENLLISKLRNDLIITKSLNDTLGRRMFYLANEKDFVNEEMGKINVLSFADSSTYLQFENYKTTEKPYKLFRGIRPLYFIKNEYVLNNEAKRKLVGLISILNKKPYYKVEIGGHSDINEEEQISQLRIKEIVNYLVENGLPLTRILEVDFKSSKLADRFDWSKNQRVSFQFFSDAEEDLAQIFNEKIPGSVINIKNQISKKDFTKAYQQNWATQEFTKNIGGRIEQVSLTLIKKNNSKKPSSAEVIEAYQKYLEKDLVEKLKTKYSVKVDEDITNKIIEKIKN